MKNKIRYILPSLIIGVLMGILFVHYYELHKIQELKSTNINSYSIEELKKKVWIKGDINSYIKLQATYRESSPEDFLFWAMFMANKYGYPKAYEDVYYSIEESYSSDSAIFKMDDKTRTFALDYLKLAAEKNDTSASDKINELKKMNIPLDWLK